MLRILLQRRGELLFGGIGLVGLQHPEARERVAFDGVMGGLADPGADGERWEKDEETGDCGEGKSAPPLYVPKADRLVQTDEKDQLHQEGRDEKRVVK